LQQPAQQLAFAEEVLLADEFLERARPHACSERLRFLEVGVMNLAEEVDGIFLRMEKVRRPDTINTARGLA
jgi:hypothetical protein